MVSEKIKLPKQPSQESIQLLLRARLMLGHAQEHASQDSEFDNMIAILGLDNTIEYILRCIASHLDLESITGKSFDIFDLSSLASSINSTLKEIAQSQLPYLGDIKLLRQTRNLVQHGVVAPRADLERFSKVTSRFFDKVLISIFGFRLEELKTSVAIKNNLVKNFIVEAENKIEEKQWLESIVASRNAFDNMYFERAKQLDVSISLYPALVYEREKSDISIYAFETIKKELELTYLGINNAEYRRFKNYIDHIPSGYRPEDSYGNIVMQRPWTRDDALFCYNFVANTILRWQFHDKGKLYPLISDKEYIFNESIAGINITKHSEGGCYYCYDDNNRLYLFYTSKQIKRRFDKVKKNKEYLFKTVSYIDGKRDSVVEEKIILLGKYIFLMTSEPEKWGIVIWYKTIESKP